MPNVSRRTFLRAAVTVTTASALPTGWATRASATPARAGIRPQVFARRADEFSRARFAAHAGRPFRMTAEGPRGRVTRSAVLTDIGDAGPRRAAGDNESFTLLFRTNAGDPATQGVHRFHRSGFGEVDLFAVPVDRGVSHQYYQVVVSRPVHRSLQRQGAHSVRTVSR